MKINQKYDAAYRVLHAPRRLLSLPLPIDFTPPCAPEVLTRLSERVGDLLGLESVTPLLRCLAPQQWLLAFFHGQEQPHRAATYEHGRPGAVVYVPRNVAMLVADVRHGIGYVSASDMTRVGALLTALNGVLFPSRAACEPFQTYCFDLEVFRLLRSSDRHNGGGMYPWQHLLLKFLTWTEVGTDAPLTKQLWQYDGFEALDVCAFAWPKHPMSAGFKFFPINHRGGFCAELVNDSGSLRATLSPQTLPTLASLVRLGSHNGTALRMIA